MPKKTSAFRFSKEDKWADISARFCRFHGLPYGSALKIVYEPCAQYPNGRVQRDNTVYRRALFKKGKLEQVDDDDTVSGLINDHLLPYVDLDLKGQRASIKAFAPDGRALGPTYKIKNWRKEPAKLTEEEIEAANEREMEIDEVTREGSAILANLSEFRWDPEEVVLPGMLRALVEEYGIEAVGKALDAMRRGKRRR